MTKELKEFTLLQLFSVVDGRLSTSMSDVYDIYNHVYDHQYDSTIALLFADEQLRKDRPIWFVQVEILIEEAKQKVGNDFNALMDYIKANNAVFKVDCLTALAQSKLK